MRVLSPHRRVSLAAAGRGAEIAVSCFGDEVENGERMRIPEGWRWSISG